MLQPTGLGVDRGPAWGSGVRKTVLDPRLVRASQSTWWGAPRPAPPAGPRALGTGEGRAHKSQGPGGGPRWSQSSESAGEHWGDPVGLCPASRLARETCRGAHRGTQVRPATQASRTATGQGARGRKTTETSEVRTENWCKNKSKASAPGIDQPAATGGAAEGTGRARPEEAPAAAAGAGAAPATPG